jgi:hypothetical protein
MTTHKEEVPWSTCYVLLMVGELEIVSGKAILSQIGMTHGWVCRIFTGSSRRRFAHDMTFIATNEGTHMSAAFS